MELLGEDFPLKVIYPKTKHSYLVNSDGTVVQFDENAVAMIKDQFYETLQAAVNAVSKDNTKVEIVLLQDDDENISIPENTNIILNLNSKTLNGGDSTTINAKGILVIKNGTIKSEKRHALYNQGDTTIDGANTLLTSSSTGIATITNTANSKLTVLSRNY